MSPYQLPSWSNEAAASLHPGAVPGRRATTTGLSPRSADARAAAALVVDHGPARAPVDPVVMRRQIDEALGFLSPVAVAGAGVAGAASPLPHLDAIQASFGRHDLGDVRAQVGGAAATAAAAIGADAYATGGAIGFRAAPDLHTAAHEAAHVVQQRAGVALRGGMGEADDPYERHADRVADEVVRGRPAEAILDELAPNPAGRGAVQRQEAVPATPAAEPAPAERLSSYDGNVKVYAAIDDDAAAFTITKGTRVEVTATTSGWVEVQIVTGVHAGATGFMEARYLVEEVARTELALPATVCVVLAQEADANGAPSEQDHDDSRHFARKSAEVASARDNCVGINLASGGLMLGVPTWYTSGADIVRALTAIGDAAAPSKIDEIHVMGHMNSSGIMGTEHNLGEGLYNQASYARREAARQDVVAPKAGTVEEIYVAEGAAFVVDAGPVDLLRIGGEAVTLPAQALVDPDDNEFAVAAVHVAVGAVVAAGDPLMTVGWRGDFIASAQTASVAEVEDIAREHFAGDVRIVLHGCNSGKGDDSLSEHLYQLIQSALPDATDIEVWGHDASIHCGDDKRWVVFDADHPDGHAASKAPEDLMDGLAE